MHQSTPSLSSLLEPTPLEAHRFRILHCTPISLNPPYACELGGSILLMILTPSSANNIPAQSNCNAAPSYRNIASIPITVEEDPFLDTHEALHESSYVGRSSSYSDFSDKSYNESDDNIAEEVDLEELLPWPTEMLYHPRSPAHKRRRKLQR